MKRLIITTLILLIAAASVTVVYFKNLNPQGQRTSQIMNIIPDNAAVIFEFNNDKGFYDIFNNNGLFTAIAGRQTIDDLNTIRRQLLSNRPLEPFFTGQNFFISLHPLKDNNIDLLLTTSAARGFNLSVIEQMAKSQHNGLLITPVNFEGKKGYTLYSNILKKRFYLVNIEGDIFSGSFSKDLVAQAAKDDPIKNKRSFVLLPDQQNSNSLANLYVNYSQLNLLFEQLFKNKNTDIFKSFRSLSDLAALSLNYRSDALMFSGFTNIADAGPANYLNLFVNQQPISNHLKDIFPSTTAYSISFAVSDPEKFKLALSQSQEKAGLQNQKDSLFKKINTETGINLVAEFNQLLGNEFAVVTTRYQEKIAIITIKDGSKFKSILNNISTTITDKTGQFNYDKLPFFLLGEPYTIFKHPYFMLIDNYLILANSTNELASYYDTYLNRKFLSQMEQHNKFDNLLAERCNVTWFINFKNAQPLLKNELSTRFYNIFDTGDPGWKTFYAAAYQFVANEKKFYTNFSMSLRDTTFNKKQSFGK